MDQGIGIKTSSSNIGVLGQKLTMGKITISIDKKTKWQISISLATFLG